MSAPSHPQKGDVIAAVQMNPYTQCGSIQLQHNVGRLGYNAITATDVGTTGSIANASQAGSALAVDQTGVSVGP